MKKILFYVIFTITTTSHAQYNPEIFANLYTAGSQYDGIRNLRFSTTLNNELYFVKQNDYDYDLYATDGTVSNTRILKNVTQVLNLVAFDNHVYFSFRDDNNGVEVWKTDGTVGGTIRVGILGGSGIAAHNFVVVDNKLFFASGSTDVPYLNRLYMINAGSNTITLLNANLKDVESITKYNDKVVLHGTELETTSITRELYISDGTQAGTYLLKDIKPGIAGSDPTYFMFFQNKMYFTAEDGTSGRELWVTDGTSAGTMLFKDLNPGLGDGINELSAGIYNNRMYFKGNNKLWSTDGTPSGTNLFMDIGISASNNFVIVNNKLLFLSSDFPSGSELWSTDGTVANTNRILEINPGTGSATYELRQSNAICTDQLFFNADNGGYNIEPWVTDGTAAGTHLIEDLNPAGASVDYETEYKFLNGNIYFSVKSSTGSQLYVMGSCANLGAETIQNTAFKIFPNPTKDFLNIETTAEIAKVEIYNTLGQLVNTVAENQKQIDVNDLTNGIYFLNITTTNNQKSVQRFIKE